MKIIMSEVEVMDLAGYVAECAVESKDTLRELNKIAFSIGKEMPVDPADLDMSYLELNNMAIEDTIKALEDMKCTVEVLRYDNKVEYIVEMPERLFRNYIKKCTKLSKVIMPLISKAVIIGYKYSDKIMEIAEDVKTILSKCLYIADSKLVNEFKELKVIFDRTEREVEELIK